MSEQVYTPLASSSDPPRRSVLGRTGHSVPAADLSGMSMGSDRTISLNSDEFPALTSATFTP